MLNKKLSHNLMNIKLWIFVLISLSVCKSYAQTQTSDFTIEVISAWVEPMTTQEGLFHHLVFNIL
jgi:hypothetical protein